MTKRIWGLGTALVGALLLAAPVKAQSNYINFNNGSEFAFVLAGQNSATGQGNLLYRCYPQCVLYAPNGLGLAGLDVTGWQWASATLVAGPGFGFPLTYFVNDTSLTCILSAAVGGGFPPSNATILASANTIAAYYFYTSVPCAFPTAWWFSFAGSAAFEAPNPAAGGGNLLAGWADKNITTTFNYQYEVGSGDEAANAASRSWANLCAVGGAIQHYSAATEWEMEITTNEAAINPEAFIAGAYDLGGSGGYSPKVGVGNKVRFRTMDTKNAASGYATINEANILFQTSCNQCHLPGFTLLGRHLALNVDILWILMFSSFLGPAYTPASFVGPFWNPNAGWTPGGESATVAALPIAAPGLVNLQLCFGSYSFKIGGVPTINDASNGSQLRFK